MSTKRMGRINEDVQRELATLIRSVKDPRVPPMTTITHVEVTNDLSYATVFVSALGQVEVKEVLKGLKSASGFLRSALGSALNLRHTPQLIFQWDESMERGAKIETLLRNLEQPADDA